MNKINFKFPFFLILFYIFFSNFEYIWSGINNWILKVDNIVEFNIKDFEDQFLASLNLQLLSQPFLDKKDIEVAKQNKQLKKIFLENLINDILIKKELYSKGLLQENILNKKIKSIIEVIKRGFIRQLYIDNIKSANIKKKNDPQIVKLIYEKIKNMDKFKSYSKVQLYKLAKKQAYYKELELNYMESLNKLREKYKIKLMEGYINKLD